MAESIVTDIAKEKMLKARAGVSPLPPIVGMAFGDGAKNVSGGIIAPTANQTALNNELLRKANDSCKEITKLIYRYSCTLDEGELANKFINEIALYDSDGDLIAIKTFLDKGKDSDQEMVFEIDDTF